MTAKQLFQLRDEKNNVIPNKQGQPMYFRSKTMAKRMRTVLSEKLDKPLFITPGPDHRMFKEVRPQA